MTTVTPTSPDALTGTPYPRRSVTVRRTVASELIKLRTLTSHRWLLVVAFAFTLLLGPFQSVGELVASESQVEDSAGAVSLALTGTSTAAVLLGVLGVLVVAGEYVPRAIRTTFTLVPQRRHVVVAKALALAACIAVLSVPVVAVAVTASLGILARSDLEVGWGSPHVLRVSASMVWYLVGWAVLGLTSGWITRSKIGGAALLLGVMLALGPVLALIPGRVGDVLTGLLPSSAGGAMISTHHTTALAAPQVGFALWTGYVVGSVALSAWVASQRDV